MAHSVAQFAEYTNGLFFFYFQNKKKSIIIYGREKSTAFPAAVITKLSLQLLSLNSRMFNITCRLLISNYNMIGQ
jgi:hypothetical protein